MLLTMMVMMSADLESIDRLIPQTPSPSKNTLWALPNDKTAERQTEKKKKDKKTERQKDKMTERQKDKMTERQKDSKKYKNTKIQKLQKDKTTKRQKDRRKRPILATVGDYGFLENDVFVINMTIGVIVLINA